MYSRQRLEDQAHYNGPFRKAPLLAKYNGYLMLFDLIILIARDDEQNGSPRNEDSWIVYPASSNTQKQQPYLEIG